MTSQDVDIFHRRFGKHCRLRAGYGASEYMPAMQFFIGQADEVTDVIPLGYPVHGCDISLLDANGDHVPAGEPGEIVITSRYLGLGYWGDDERTAQAFRGNPNKMSRTYQTNDIGYRDSDGLFHFAGRKDDIVKINGKQVCMEDVRRSLIAIPWVSDAVIVPVTSSRNGTELIAFVVSAKQPLTISQLRAELSLAMPYESMPAQLVTLNEIPLTANNKVDLQQLKRIAEIKFAI